MDKFKNNKKLFAIILVFVIAGGFFVLNTPSARAADFNLFGFLRLGDLITTVISWLFVLVTAILSKILLLAASLVQLVLDMSRTTDVPVVNQGWQITRGLCNMFFALILLIMAIATILQIESFGAKKLLVRLVIVALLINFSLLFAGIIVDFSQVLTSYFVDAAKGTNGQGITEQLMKSLGMSRAIDANPNNQVLDNDFCGGACEDGLVCTVGGCAEPVSPENNPRAQVKTGISAGGGLQVLIGSFFSVILTLVAAFSMLAAAVFLVFRIVAIWFLLIFSPLAWLSWITGTGGLWKKWWQHFFKWTFFAPIYTFFLYLGIMLASSGSLSTITEGTSGIATNPGILNSLAGGSIALTLQYVIIIMILLGGLYIAQTSGIMGAKAITNFGKSAAKWSAKKATGYERWSPKVVEKAGQALAVVGFTKTGGALQGKSVEMKEKQMKQKTDELYNKYLNSLNDKDLLDRLEKGGRREKIQAAKIAKERGLFNKEDPATRAKAKEAYKTLKNFGLRKEARDMEEAMPDIVEDAKDREEATERAIANGTDKRWKEAVFKSPYGKEIVAKMNQLKTPQEMTATLKGYTKPIKDAATEKINEYIKEKPDEETIEKTNLRKTYASVTGSIATGFAVSAAASKDTRKKIEDEMRTYIKELKPAQIGDIKESDAESWRLLADTISRDMVASIRGELNQRQKEALKKQAKELGRTELTIYMENSPAWGGRLSQEKEAPKITIENQYASVPPKEERKNI